MNNEISAHQNGIEILSIDITNQCHKECPFCYNTSKANNIGQWDFNDVLNFVTDCVQCGVKAISLGGGEPFEHPEIFKMINAIYPIAYLTITTNGLPLLNSDIRDNLTICHPDKIHISIHNPDNLEEVSRVISQIKWIESIGIAGGVNLLVSNKLINQTKRVYDMVSNIISPDRIILLPMRYSNTPTPNELVFVTSNRPFQSASCLTKCNIDHKFASVTWDKKVNWCSFSPNKAKLKSLTFHSLMEALNSIKKLSCN